MRGVGFTAKEAYDHWQWIINESNKAVLMGLGLLEPNVEYISGDLEVLEKAFGTLGPQAESVTQEEFDGVIDAALKAVL